MIIRIMVALMFGAILFRLFSLQIIKGQEYKAASVEKISTTTVENAPRGEILDRYGRPLVTNRIGYSVKIKKTGLKSEELNSVFLKLLNILRDAGYEYEDTLPFSFAPYEYSFEDKNNNGTTDDEKKDWLSERKKIKEEMTPDEVIEYYRKNVFNIDEHYSDEDIRRIIGIRYDADISGFSATVPYTVKEDVDMRVVSIIKERQDELSGVYISEDYIRRYEYETLAAHFLGAIGKLNKEEYAKLNNEGYGYNDLIGKSGIEKLEENHLRGTDGRKNAMKDIGENEDITLEDIPAVPGDYVTLTIDAELQKAAEESLRKNIKSLHDRGTGADAGTAVVLDVASGEVLACANYPTYNPATFNKDYEELIKDSAKPIWNRALNGTYTPGSTLKPLIAIAALESGTITENEKIKCDGIYDFYNDYKPKCWILTSKNETHGELNVTGAIANSCNCFFYEAGRRCGIEVMNKYANMYGLCEKTGIELDEGVGVMSNPEYKKKLAGENGDATWYPGDIIQTAIGQSYSFFTPIQLASYISMIANGGTRYKTHIVKSVRSSVDGALIEETQTKVIGKAEVSQATINAVKKGMLGVADEGSASTIFADYPVKIAGKTGTAQVSRNKSDNALFVAFAPYDKPEIALCIVIEKGKSGANAAYVAKDIFDEYFGIDEMGEIGDEIGYISDLLR